MILTDDSKRTASQHEASQQAGDSSSSDQLRSVRHDLKHALYVFDLALTLLQDSRADEERFSEVMGMLRKEQETVNHLVEEVLALAAGKLPKSDD